VLQHRWRHQHHLRPGLPLPVLQVVDQLFVALALVIFIGFKLLDMYGVVGARSGTLSGLPRGQLSVTYVSVSRQGERLP
jgi:hypothetical protein